MRGGELRATEYGRVESTVILDQFDGKRLNSPNGRRRQIGTVRSGSPTRLSGFLGKIRGRGGANPRITHQTSIGSTGRDRRAATVVAGGHQTGPNGLCFSPGRSQNCIVVEIARPGPRLIRVFRCDRGTAPKLANGRVFRETRGKGTTGRISLAMFRGNLWCGLGDGPAQKNGRRRLCFRNADDDRTDCPPGAAAPNLCFGGPQAQSVDDGRQGRSVYFDLR